MKIIYKFLLPAMVLVLLCGCGTTHITREDQLAHFTTGTHTQPSPETMAVTTVSTTEATAAETVSTTCQTLPPETAKPTAAKPPATKEPQPPATTAPATEPARTEPAKADPYDISGYACGSLEYAIADAINASRQEAGRSALTFSGRLSAIASVRAYEASVSFSHTRPSGGSFSGVLSDYGYGYSRAAENLLQCSSGYTAADMVNLWMGSKGHRDNLLSPDSTTLGIGVYRENGMVYVAAIFTG